MADGNRGEMVAVETTPTVRDVRAWIEARRARSFPGREYVSISEALSDLQIDVCPLEGSDRAVLIVERMMEDDPLTLLLPSGVEEATLGKSFRFAIGLAILLDMGEAVPKAIAYDEGNGAWDEAEQIGAMMLISTALIDRVVPRALQAIAFDRGSLSQEASRLVTREIVKSFGGDEACEKALGDDFEGTIGTAVCARAFGGEDVTVMLAAARGLKSELEYVRKGTETATLDRCHRLAAMLGRDARSWLTPATRDSIDIIAVAAECGVRVDITDEVKVNCRSIVFHGRRAFVLHDIRAASFAERKWRAGACAEIATSIGVAAMIRYGLITLRHLKNDDIDYSIAGEIGALMLVPQLAIDAAAEEAVDETDDRSEGRNGRFAVRMRAALLRSNSREEYDLGEILHVAAFATCGLDPYTDNGELVAAEVM